MDRHKQYYNVRSLHLENPCDWLKHYHVTSKLKSISRWSSRQFSSVYIRELFSNVLKTN